MRIGMILDKVFPPDPRVENEALSLIKEGYNVFLCCLTYNSDEVGVEVYKGINLYRVKSYKWLYKMSALVFTIPIYQWVMTPKIRKFVNNCKIDIIHAHDLPIASSVLKACQNKSIPTILDLHENRPEIMKLYPHLQSFWKRLLIAPAQWKKAEEKLVQKFHKIIVVTQEAKQELLSRVSINPSNVVVVSNTIHDDFNRSKKNEANILERYQGKIVLLYIGDTALRRGLLTAITAMPLLIKRIPSIKLVIVGSSTEDVVLKEKTLSLNIESYVDFEGWQPEDTFSSYIQSAFVGISPLLPNIHHDTTYANKLFQYMSFGKPIVISNVLAQENLIKKYPVGFSHLANDENSFAKAVITLYEDQKIYQQCANHATAVMKNEFSLETTHKALKTMYQQINIAL